MGKRKCVVRGCTNREGKTGKEGKRVKLFGIPKESARRERWLKVLGLVKESVPSSWCVCEVHFPPDQWETGRCDGERALRMSAVPFVQLNDNSENDSSPFHPKERNQSFTPVPINQGLKNVEDTRVENGDHSFSINPRQPFGDISNSLTINHKPVQKKRKCPVGSSVSVMDHSYTRNILKNTSMVNPDRELNVSEFPEAYSTSVKDHSYTKKVNPDGQLNLTSVSGSAILSTPWTNTSMLDADRQDLNSSAVSEAAGSLELLNSSVVNPDEQLNLTSISGSAILSTPLTNTSMLDADRQDLNSSAVSEAAGSLELVNSSVDIQCGGAAPKSERARVEMLEARVQEQEKFIKALKDRLDKQTKLGDKLQKQYNTVDKANKVFKSRIFRMRKSHAQRRQILRQRLHDDQVRALERRSTRGMRWSPATLRVALIYKMKWGNRGYTDFVKKYPMFPSLRTLQDAVKHLAFKSGVLQEVFDCLEVEVPKWKSQERDCVLVIDEMSIKEGELLDASTNTVIGKATFPAHTGLANKALVVMLAGVSSRWKFAVAYYLTSKESDDKRKKRKEGASDTGEALRGIVLMIMEKAENIGLLLSTIISDMGWENQAMWKAFGVGRLANGDIVWSIPHPIRLNAKLFFMPDPVHAFKNVLPTLDNNQVFILPEEVVIEEDLNDTAVTMNDIDDLLKFEEHFELKIAFRLTEEKLHCENQYDKMKVGTSRSVFNKRTASGLRAKAWHEGRTKCTPTEYFVSLLDLWFQLVTNRGRKLALSKAKPEFYEAALAILRKMAALFRKIKIGSQGHWKTIQTAVVMISECLLQLQDCFLNDRLYEFLLLGRFTQDCLENLFSLIRFRMAVPNALLFKHNLKVITLTQLCLNSNNTSYSCDDNDDGEGVRADFLTYSRQVASAKKETTEEEARLESDKINIPEVSDRQLTIIDPWELNVLYDMAGSVLKSILKLKLKTCSTCVNAVQWKNGGDANPYAMALELREYKEGALIQVSEACFFATLKAEITFRQTREFLKTLRHMDIVSFLVKKLQYVWEGSDIPTCHDITAKILKRFLTMRFKTYSQHTRRADKKLKKKKKKNKVYSSKTMGMHTAVE